MKIALEYVPIDKLYFDDAFNIFPEKWQNRPVYYDPYIHAVKQNKSFTVIYGHQNKSVLNKVSSRKNDFSPFFSPNSDKVLCIVVYYKNFQTRHLEILQIVSYLIQFVKSSLANDPLYKTIFKHLVSKLFDQYNILPEEYTKFMDMYDIMNTAPAFPGFLNREHMIYLYSIKPDNKTIHLLSKLSCNRDLYALLNFIFSLQFNKNYFKISCEIISELVYRGKTDELATAFNTLRPFFADPKITASQKTEKFIAELQTLYYPSYIQKNTDIHRLISSWNLKTITLTHSPFYENKDFKLSASVSNKQSLQNIFNDFEILKKHLGSLWDKL